MFLNFLVPIYKYENSSWDPNRWDIVKSGCATAGFHWILVAIKLLIFIWNYLFTQRAKSDFSLSFLIRSDNRKVLAVHFSGKLSVWEIPSLRRVSSWRLEEQPGADDVHPMILEKRRKRPIRDILEMGKVLPPSLFHWWFCAFVWCFSMFAVFLDATMHLYKRSWPFVRPSVRPSIRRSVRPALFSNDEYGRFWG